MKGTTHARRKVAAPKVGANRATKRRPSSTYKRTAETSAHENSERSIRKPRAQGQRRISANDLSDVRESRGSLSASTHTVALQTEFKAPGAFSEANITAIAGWLFLLFGALVIYIAAGLQIGSIFLCSYIGGYFAGKVS